jgi:hypothetical protein
MIILDSMGHLYSDESLQELYDFAVKKLKMNPKWNHYSRHFPHFDLTTANKKKQAISLGAKLVDARDDIVGKDGISRYKIAKKVFKEFYIENKHLVYWYYCTGLYKQKIMRIDFEKLGIR